MIVLGSLLIPCLSIGGVILIGFIYVVCKFLYLCNGIGEGTVEMREIALIIRNGSKTFIRIVASYVVVIVVAIAIIFSLLYDLSCGLTFALGSLMSGVVCVVGMRTATYANVRTTNTALETRSIGKTVKTAFTGGSIIGLNVQIAALFGLALIILLGGLSPSEVSSGTFNWISFNASITRLTTYSLGCSLVAMFNRVAGGNFTKAADISSDILAKIRHDMPEDDARVPNILADFTGDNVNDVAGNCSDLLESYVATLVASLVIAIMLFNNNPIPVDTFDATCQYPLLLAGGGFLSCIVGVIFIMVKKLGENPSKILNMVTYISAGLTIIIGFFAAMFTFKDVQLYDDFKLGWVSPWLSAVLGIVSGVLVGVLTEYYTSADYKPTRTLAEISKEGAAFTVIKGNAVGSRSCLLPALLIGAAILISGLISGVYGIAISAIGMLAFVGATVAIDAFGPIADNAGGIAESCHLGEDIRKITDTLDSAGNTTAAIGKGFAIGSAAYAAVSLIIAYVGSYMASGAEPILNFASFTVIAGGIVGGALIEYFAAMLTDNTVESAVLMANEGDRQLSDPDILSGKKKPDYIRCIDLATRQALKKMIKPSLLALIAPLSGIIFGLDFVGGLLVGATVVAIPKALFMSNAGGAFDNAKKYIESGRLEGFGKGSLAHKAAVVGDMLGDIFKDVVGVDVNIFIKMMSTVAMVLAPIFMNVALIK